MTIFSQSTICQDELRDEGDSHDDLHALVDQYMDRNDREDLLQPCVKSVGRRVIRAIPGGFFKQFRNRFSYTGGGSRTGAKPCDFDDTYGKRARQLALEAACLADMQEQVAALPRLTLVDSVPDIEPEVPSTSSQAEPPADREVEFFDLDCKINLIYHGGQLAYACAEKIRRISDRKPRQRSQR